LAGARTGRGWHGAVRGEPATAAAALIPARSSGPDARPLRVYYVYAPVFLGQTSRENVDLSFSGATAAGWRNFQLVLTDPLFWKSIENNLLFAAVQIAAALTLGFFIAVSLSSGVRFRRFFYIAFLLPSLVPLSLFATVFGQMIQTNGGALNQALHASAGALPRTGQGIRQRAMSRFPALTYLIGLPIMTTMGLTTVNTAGAGPAQIDGVTAADRLILFPMPRHPQDRILSVLLGSFRWFELICFHQQSAQRRHEHHGTYIYGRCSQPAAPDQLRLGCLGCRV
jgi:ABC-type sugar transport system permease subunit